MPKKRRKDRIGLGRREPTDYRHIERFPLTLATTPSAATPVVLGVNWYDRFFDPEKIGTRWWIGRGSSWGPIAGGHAIVAKPVGVSDLYTWWSFYDQGSEGACVGFSSSRAVSFTNRERYDARWLYREAQKIDEWPGESYDGTSVRAGMEVLRTVGHRRFLNGVSKPSDTVRGIAEYRWASTVDAVLDALAEDDDYDVMKKIEAIPLFNSWGRSYPQKVWLPLSALERLLDENGEAAVMIDR
jgi:hypothetical protein